MDVEQNMAVAQCERGWGAPLATVTTLPSHSPAPKPKTTSVSVSGSGTLNFIPLWTPNGSTLGNSAMFQTGGAGLGGKVGVGTMTPTKKLDVNGNATVRGSFTVPSSTGKVGIPSALYLPPPTRPRAARAPASAVGAGCACLPVYRMSTVHSPQVRNVLGTSRRWRALVALVRRTHRG